MALQFFLGANTKDGFFSLYERLTAEQSRRIYVVKSGPGSGKSTCMRNLAQRLGGAEEMIFCSSDPGSLDGVIFHDFAILDGTAPHVWEPNFPGCLGDYLTLPDYVDTPALRRNESELLQLQQSSKQHYAQAYRLLAAAALTRERRHVAAAAFFPEEKLVRRVRGIGLRELPVQAGRGVLRVRFADGITPLGQMFLSQTFTECAQRRVILQDSYGFAPLLLEPLRDLALQRGHDVYACMDPLDPRRILHLLIPDLSLAYITDDGKRPILFEAQRRIRIDSMLPPKQMRAIRGKLRLMLHVEESLLDDAVQEISAAHALHDRMEDIYRPHIQIAAMESAYQRLVEKIRSQA